MQVPLIISSPELVSSQMKMQSAAHYWSVPRVKVYSRYPLSNVDRYPRLTLNDHLNRHSVNISADAWSTLNWHLNWQSVESSLIFTDTPLSVDWYILIGLHSANYGSTVDRVSIECWSRCWSSVSLVLTNNIDWDVDQDVNRDVNRGYWSTADAFSTHDPIFLGYMINLFHVSH